MDSTERHVRTWMASSREQDVDSIVADIANGTASLLNVVKALGEYLTSEEDEIRTKGVELLSSVLIKCPAEKFNHQSVRTLTVFYISKLDDTETIVPALKGLVTLSTLSQFTSSDATEVVKALFNYVKMRALVQSVRFSVFSIVDSVMARHRDALKEMGAEFLSGYINLADGEKDPRNLMLAFAIDRVIGIEFDITAHIENFFNIVFCYFPITFRPPPDDPYGITAEDLKKTLQSCLSSNPAFGNLAIPLFIEKLTAGSPATKRDTLQTLSLCMPVYGRAVVQAHAKKLWNSLRLEIFQPTDLITENEALKTTQDLIKVIYPPVSDDAMQEDIQGLAKDICDECLRILREPEKSQSTPATKVFNAFLVTTPAISHYALSLIVPHLLKLFSDPEEITNRPATMTHLSDVVSAARDVPLPEPAEPMLAPYKDKVLGAFTTGLKVVSAAVPSLKGLKGMVGTKNLLTDEELGYVVHSVDELLQGDDENDASDAALDLLSAISATSPKHVEQQTLPLLFHTLPDVAPTREADAERQRIFLTLASLRKLCTQSTLFETLVIRIISKVDLLADRFKSEHDSEPVAAYIHALLHTLAQVLADKVEKKDADVPKYVDRLLPHVFELFISVNGTGHSLASDARLVEVASQAVGLIMQTLPHQKQQSFYSSLFSAYLDGNTAALVARRKSATVDTSFLPFSDGASASQKAVIPLFTAAIVPAHKEVQLPVEDLSGWVQSLMNWSVHGASNQHEQSAALQVVSSVVNKKIDELPTLLAAAEETFWKTEISPASVSPETRRRAINAWTWLTKALLVRNHPSAPVFAQRLFELFGDEDSDVAWDAARALGVIGGTDEVLTKTNHAVIRLLWAQKYCNLILPRLINPENQAEPRQKTASLVGLASLIQSIPKITYSDQMPKLLPLLIQGLELPDAEIRANVIDTLYVSAEGLDVEKKTPEHSAISEHASTLVSTMLKNSRVKDVSSVRVRIAALRYLGLLPSVLRSEDLQPQKTFVLRELALILDDPKKIVRKEAVDARSKWYTFSG